MTIPAARLDKLNAAIMAADLSTATDVILPPDCDEIPNIGKHPGEHYIAFMDSERIEDSARRNAIQKAIAAEGFTVCAHGVYWKEPVTKADSRKKKSSTDANGATVNNSGVDGDEPVAAPDNLEADGAADTSEAAPDAEPETSVAEPTGVTGSSLPDFDIDTTTETTAVALHTEAVKDAAPAKPRIEVKTVVQTFRVNQPEIAQMVNDQYERYLNEGWIEADSASVLNPVGDSYQFVRVVTFKRTV